MPYDGSRTTRCSQYVAPTWSWASIKGKVHFPSGGSSTHDTLTFISVNMDREADNHPGTIPTTNLILLAKVRRLCEVVKKPEDSWYPLDLRLDGEKIGNGAFDVNNERNQNPIWMMECLFQKPLDFRDHPSALLLEKLGNSPNTYQRVGVGRMNEEFLGFFDDCELQEVVLV